MKSFSTLVFVALVLLTGCKTLKQSDAQNAPLPNWAKTKPVNSLYYTGIGSASKIGFAPADYTQTAQQQALGDLSREISVTISSSSVLSVIENNYHINENWSSEIKASSDIFLQGYELVETWENKEYYWVYYRLSKDKHESLKAQRKNQAINDALLKYNEGIKQLNNNAYFEAFSFFADALAVLKPYMGESTAVNVNGENTDIARLCFSSMIDVLQSLQVKYSQSELEVVRGKNIASSEKTLMVYDTKNNPIANIPVEVSLSSGNLIQTKYVSDNTGKIVCDMNKITSSNKNETLSSGLDMVTWSRVTKDPLVRNIIRQIPVSKSTLLITIRKPAFYIESFEKQLGQPNNKTILRDAMQGSLAADNTILNSELTADFKIQIASDATISASTNGYCTAIVEMTVSMSDNRNDLKYQKRFTAEGEGDNNTEAINDAYKEASITINRKVNKEINNLLFGNLP